MSHHLTYFEAVVTGLIQGVTELFPVSSLGHNVLIPALIGGSWAHDLNVSDPGSPYLSFVVGLHVATAIAMIVFFWRDWLRIIRGFFSSLRTRSITTPDERLAWMIILATIPVGIVGAAGQKWFVSTFAKPEAAAAFLAINGVILLVSERMRRVRGNGAGRGGAVAGTPTVVLPAGGGVPSGPVPGGPGGPSWGPAGPGGPGWSSRPGPGPEGYSQQPWQQQWQGPDPRDPRYGQQGNPQYPGNGQPQFRPDPRGGQPGHGQQPQYQPDPRGGQPGYGPDPRGGQPGYGQPGYGQPQYQPGPQGGYPPQDQRAGRGPQGPGGRHAGGHAAGRRPAPAPMPAADGVTTDHAVAADRRLSTMGWVRAVFVGAAQILALFPGISRDG